MKLSPRSCGLYLVVLATSCLSAIAAPVGSEKAALAVQGWLKGNAAPLQVPMSPTVQKVEPITDATGAAAYYVVHLAPSGFVIVPADDLVEPIIAFAREGTLGAQPHDCLADLVRGDVPARVLQARSLGGKALSGPFLAASDRWQRLLQSATQQKGLPSISIVRVAPFVLSRWNQSTAPSGVACYNYYTPPHDPGDTNNYVCGCVATAMAQLMRYHQYPTDGVGTGLEWVFVDYHPLLRSKRGGGGTGGPYFWGSMPLNPTSPTPVQCGAIGDLTADAGVAAHMSYTGDESGAFLSDARNALAGTFMYSSAVYGNNGGNNIGPGLYPMVNPNLDARFPVLFGIYGHHDGKEARHAILCDGYGYDSSTPYHHLNLGWGGNWDAWYNLPTIDTPYLFTNVYECVYNVYPSGSGEIISGSVRDNMGNPVPNATVLCIGASSGVYTASTDDNGIYAATRVAPGTPYTVLVMKTGYATGATSCTTGYSANSQPTSGNVWALDVTLVPSTPPATLLSENFENGFPANGWSAARWDDTFASFGNGGAHGGSYKCYCSASQHRYDGNTPLYMPESSAYMQHSLNLTGYNSATLKFWGLIPSIASCCATGRVMLDSTVLWSSSSVISSWTLTTIDLAPYLGSNHTLRFEFNANADPNTAEGWYVDDILVTGIPAPVNDQCAGAITLTGGAPYTMTNTYATSLGDPLPDCQENFGKGVWFKYTPTGSGPLLVSTCGSTFDTVLAVYRGNCSALTQVACCDNAGPGCSASQASVMFTATAGTNYYILAGGYQGASGTLQILAQLANDQCAGAIALTVGSTYSLNTSDAASGADEVPTCGYGGGKGVWFTFTPASSGVVTFSTCGSDFDTIVQGYTGACGALTPIANGCQDDGFQCAGRTSYLQFSGTSGTTYRFLVTGYGNASGNLSVVANLRTAATLTVNAKPANGVYVDAYPGDISAQPGGTVPFTRTHGAGTLVYLTAPASDGFNVFQKWQLDGVDYSLGTITSLTLNAGHTATAVYVLPNDQCSGARPLAANTPYQMSTTNATSTGDPAAVCTGTISNSVWFSFTPATSGAAAISTCGSDFDTFVQVWTDTCASPVILACNDDTTECTGNRQSYCTFPVTAGTPYLIQAGGYDGATGNLNILATLLPAVITAQPGGSTVNAGNSTTLSVSAYGAPPLAYQWQRGGLTLTGLTSSSLALTNIDPGLAGDYRVILSNSLGTVTSAVATVTVLPALADALDAPSFTWTTGGGNGWYRRSSISHDGADSATCTSTGGPWLQTTVSGPASVTFWWIFPATLMTTHYLGFSMDGTEQAGLKTLFGSWSQRTCYVPAGSHTLSWAYVANGSRSGGPAGVDQATYTAGATAAFVATQPVAQTAVAGASATFNVKASGTPPFVYQWQFNGTNLASATDSALTLTNVQPSQAGPYQVVLSNAYGAAATSVSAALTVTTLDLGVAVDYAGPAWTTSGDAAWFGQIGLTHDGADAAQSGLMDDSQNCGLSTTLMGPGNLGFWWKVSCYPTRDRLRLIVNGVVKTNISGEVDWQHQTLALPAGLQQVSWSYLKGHSANHSLDTAWLDQITYDGPPCLVLRPLTPEQGMLTWPATVSGFTLQSATNPLPGALWQAAPGTLSVLGDDWMMTNSLTAPRQFYRLKK